MFQLNDKRGRALNKTFHDLEYGEYYQDCNGNLCIKTGFDRCMRWGGNNWVTDFGIDIDEPIIPLKTTITVEREGD